MNTNTVASRQAHGNNNPLPAPIDLNAIELPPRDWQENRDTRQRMRDWRRKSESATSGSSASSSIAPASSSSSSISYAAAGTKMNHRTQANNRAKHISNSSAAFVSNSVASATPLPPPPIARANVGTSESVRLDSTGRKIISLKRSFEHTSISAPSSMPQMATSTTPSFFYSRAAASPPSTSSPSAMTDVTPPAVPSPMSAAAANINSEEPPKRRKLDRNFHSSDTAVALQFG